MKAIRWQLVEGPSWKSKLIGWRAGGFSHIDVMTPDGKLRGAQASVCGGAPRSGYFDRPPFYETFARRTVLELWVEDGIWGNYWRFSDAQLGKAYDNPGVWAFATGRYAQGRMWTDPDQWMTPGMKWFCSEEVAANCIWAGITEEPLYEGVNYIDPGDVALYLTGRGAQLMCDLRGKAAMKAAPNGA